MVNLNVELKKTNDLSTYGYLTLNKVGKTFAISVSDKAHTNLDSGSDKNFVIIGVGYPTNAQIFNGELLMEQGNHIVISYAQEDSTFEKSPVGKIKSARLNKNKTINNQKYYKVFEKFLEEQGLALNTPIYLNKTDVTESDRVFYLSTIDVNKAFNNSLHEKMTNNALEQITTQPLVLTSTNGLVSEIEETEETNEVDSDLN